MSSSEKFCLRWNDFESNISVAFRELREEKDFFDVTLACEDNQIQAHKVILSACSPFFRNVLRRNPHQHPLLYLKGVKYSELTSVLNFMYMGEVNVAQEELNSFLSVAEDLRVKGLTQNNSEASTKTAPKQDQSKHGVIRNDQPERDALGRPPPPKRPRPVSTNPNVSNQTSTQGTGYQTHDDDDIQEVVPVKSEPRDPPQPLIPDMRQQAVYQEEQDMQGVQDQGTVALGDTYGDGDESYDYGQYGYDDGSGLMDPNSGMAMAVGGDGNKGDIRMVVASKIIEVKEDTGLKQWQCVECGFTRKKKSVLVYHVEYKHLNQNIPCQYCTKTFVNDHALKKHTKASHESYVQYEQYQTQSSL